MANPGPKKGIPNGNKNALKSEGEKSEGIRVSLYVKDFDYDFIGKSLELEGKERNKKNVISKVRKLAKDAINLEVRRTFARMEKDFNREHEESGLPLEEFLDVWMKRNG